MSVNGGFTLGGRTARELGIMMTRNSQRPVLPGTVDRTLSIPGRNGSLDFGADLSPRMFNLECAIVKINPSSLQNSISSLASYLLDQYGKPRTMEIIFDIQPERIFYVRYAGNVTIDRIVGRGQFVLPLIAFDPHSYAELGYNDKDMLYDTGLDYDTGLYYPNAVEVQDFAFVSPGMVVPVGSPRCWSGFVWNYNRQFSTMQNYSSLRTPLVVTIAGNVADPIIRNLTTGEEMAFSLTLADETLIINGDRYSAKVDGSNALQGMSGDFVSLAPGENQFEFVGISPHATVTYGWRHKFI